MVAWHACPICCAHIQPHDDTHRVKLCVDGSLVLCICRALAQHDQPMVVAQHDHSSDGHGVEDFASRSSKQEAGRRTRLGCRPHLLRTHTPTPTERSSAWMDARQPERMRRIAADSVGKCAERARGVSTRSAHCPPLRAECREELSHAGAGWGGEGGACTPHALSEPASRRNVCGAHPHQRSPARPPAGRRCRRYTQQMGSGPGWRWWSRRSGARRLWWPRSGACRARGPPWRSWGQTRRPPGPPRLSGKHCTHRCEPARQRHSVMSSGTGRRMCTDACGSGPRRLSRSARVASCNRGRHACWLGSEKELRLSGVGVT